MTVAPEPRRERPCSRHRQPVPFGRLAVASALVAAGCAAPPAPRGPITPDAWSGVATVVQQDAGRTVELKVGQVLEARLTTYPAQGIALSLGSVVVPTLRQEGRPVHVDDAERALMGGVGSFEIWRFRAEQPGRVALTFQYRRPWESTGTPTRSLSYEVVVR